MIRLRIVALRYPAGHFDSTPPICQATLSPAHSGITESSPSPNAVATCQGLAGGIHYWIELSGSPGPGDCFGDAYYATAENQLAQLKTLIDQIDDNLFLAKLAVFARERANMKDMPAALLVVLAERDTQLMHRVFDRVVDNSRVLRTLFQLARSGQFGRTCFSSSLQ